MQRELTTSSKRSSQRNRNRRQRRLVEEMLESRLCLAQTTGLFLHDPAAADGYVLFAPNTSTQTFLIDKDANVVNQWSSSYTPGLISYLLEDGSMIRAAANGVNGQGGNGSINAAGAGGLLERFDWNGTKTWEFEYSDTMNLAHHDFEVMPNGNILLIAWEYKSEAEATQAGRDPNLPGAGYLYPDHIVEVQPDLNNGGGTIVWEWHVWDHLVQEYDATKDNWYGPTGVEDHPELIDINYVSDPANGGGAPEDWTHANGIDYNAELDQIILSVREFSEFWVIDHSTTTAEAAGHTGGNSGKGGDILYRWGNPEAYDRGDANDRVLFFQHDAKWIEDGSPGAGNITIFNNGFGRPGADYTTIEEITPPVDINGNYTISPGQPYGPASTAWTYTAALNDFSSIISGVERLPNGNTFITYGVDGTFSEVDSSGTEVWRYVNPYFAGGMLGMEQTIPSIGLTDPGLSDLLVNFTFRAQHYAPAFAPQLGSTVVDRHIFYNQSAFDGNDAAITANDNDAIAPDKSPLFPGAGQATLANITNYTRGINGIMVDLSSGVDHSGITAADFVFKAGANNSPNLWDPAPAPGAISVTPGGGVSGSDRVTITWAAGSILDTYLEVQVLATAQTGLADTDVFFWGNLLGETADATPAGAFARSVAADRGPILSGGTQINVGITSRLDINKSNSVTIAADGGPILSAGTGLLPRISIASAGPFAPEGDAGGDAGIASALASTSDDSPEASSLVTSALPRGIGNRLQTLDLNSGRIAAFFQHLADQDTPGTRKLLTRIDEVAGELGLEHDLLDDLVAGLVL